MESSGEALAAGLANRFPNQSASRTRAEGQGEVPYVIDRARKSGVRYTAMYTDENGRYKSAGTYDTQERAQAVAEQHERHVRLRLAETSPAGPPSNTAIHEMYIQRRKIGMTASAP